MTEDYQQVDLENPQQVVNEDIKMDTKEPELAWATDIPEDLVNMTKYPYPYDYDTNGEWIPAKAHHVYDGDTCKLSFFHRGEIITVSCRVKGIDTPELRTRDPEEKRAGYAARDYARRLLDNQIVGARLYRFDKYGRTLADIQLPTGEDYAEKMIREGFGVAYNGGRKRKFIQRR